MSWHTALALLAALAAFGCLAIALAADPPAWPRRNRRLRRRYRPGALPAPAARAVVTNSPEFDALRSR
jgi:hypothetical protein